jgi:hypothetical protein
MKRQTIPAIALLTMLLCGCRVGPNIEEIDAARQPAGAHVVIDLVPSESEKARQLSGELLDVRDDGVIVAGRTGMAAESRITFATWNAMKRIDAGGLPGFRINVTREASRREFVIRKFRVVGRFPQGLSPELLQELLANAGQESMDSVEY